MLDLVQGYLFLLQVKKTKNGIFDSPSPVPRYHLRETDVKTVNSSHSPVPGCTTTSQPIYCQSDRKGGGEVLISAFAVPHIARGEEETALPSAMPVTSVQTERAATLRGWTTEFSDRGLDS